MGTEGADRQQVKVREFMSLLPLTLEVAGLPRRRRAGISARARWKRGRPPSGPPTRWHAKSSWKLRSDLDAVGGFLQPSGQGRAAPLRVAMA